MLCSPARLVHQTYCASCLPLCPCEPPERPASLSALRLCMVPRHWSSPAKPVPPPTSAWSRSHTKPPNGRNALREHLQFPSTAHPCAVRFRDGGPRTLPRVTLAPNSPHHSGSRGPSPTHPCARLWNRPSTCRSAPPRCPQAVRSAAPVPPRTAGSAPRRCRGSARRGHASRRHQRGEGREPRRWRSPRGGPPPRPSAGKRPAGHRRERAGATLAEPQWQPCAGPDRRTGATKPSATSCRPAADHTPSRRSQAWLRSDSQQPRCQEMARSLRAPPECRSLRRGH
mmetsp:Transcript_15300/g.42155  ORF Transcript_15300/g.42155 Transcript_15300/m.42155 type:complete len:284 (-) Transcript_15300:705-1556(-)